MKRQAVHGGVVALTVLLCGCATNEQNGDGVALVREIMIESAKFSDGQKPVKSPEQAIRAVREWRRASEEAGGAG